MSSQTSSTLVLQTRSKDPAVDVRIDKDRYDCYTAVDGSTADKMHIIVYLRKDISTGTIGVATFDHG